MARKIYFAFNYADVRDFRVNVVRNSGVVGQRDTFIDASLWEKVKRDSDIAIKRMINKGLERTTATVVLIGSHTYDRRWVRYEIAKSFERGNAFLGVYIHNLKDRSGRTDSKGNNPFRYMGFSVKDRRVTLYAKDRVFDLVWLRCGDINPIAKQKFSYRVEPTGEHRLSDFVPVYDWVADNGYTNLQSWVESAIKQQCKSKR